MELLKRDIYEITTDKTPIHGVMFRGTIRKLCLENNINVLLENADTKTDTANAVRFALISNLKSSPNDLDLITKYIKTKILDVNVNKILPKISNPILSKLQVNKEERYTL